MQLNEEFVQGASRERPIPAKVKEELFALEAAKERLREAIDREQASRRQQSQAAELVRALGDDPCAAFDALARFPDGLDRQAAIYRLLVTGVKIGHDGKPGSARRFRILEWIPRYATPSSRSSGESAPRASKPQLSEC